MNSLDAFAQRLQELSAVRQTAPSEGSAMEQVMAQADPDFRTPVTLRNLFTHHDVHPVVLDMACLKQFGAHWLQWEAETLWREVQRIFKTQLSEHVRAKLNALRACHNSVGPWESWHVFEKVMLAFNNVLPTWQVVQALSLEQLYAGVDILSELRPETFADEVQQYMAVCVLHEQVTYTPAPLDFLQVFVSRPHYRCRDCNNVESALFHDGTCDVCARKFDAANPLNFQPHPEAQGKGKNLELLLKHDPTPVERRWHDVAHLAHVELDPDSAVDVQVMKLQLARDYMNIRRRQLSEQLVNLKSWLGTP